MKIKSVILLLTAILFLSCSEESTSPEIDLEESINLGWENFSVQEYEVALQHFLTAHEISSNSFDVKHGLGWCYGKIGQAELSLEYFIEAQKLSETNLDFLGGISFSYNLNGNYSNSNIKADQLLKSDSLWTFTYDTSVNWFDLYVLKANNYFNQGEFKLAYDQIIYLNPLFVTDISTVKGIALLASEIERLQSNP